MDLPLLFSRDEALARGWTRHQISRRIRTGRWTSLARGHYAQAARLSALSPRERHVVAVAARLRQLQPGAAASHLSAAAALGWPLPLSGPGVPTITRQPGAAPTRRTPERVVQVAGLADDEVQHLTLTVGGERMTLPVTVPRRTAADLLRHLRPEDSVAIVDAALRAGDVSPAQVERTLAVQELWPYAARARAALQLVDPRRESWLESFSFCVLAAEGLPLPEPQVSVLDEDGRFVARVDGWWDDVGVALEADGLGKYRLDTAADGPDEVAAAVARRLVQQNEREARLRELGVEVLRWGTAEVAGRPRALAARARRVREVASRRPFTGRAVPLAQPGPLPEPFEAA